MNKHRSKPARLNTKIIQRELKVPENSLLPVATSTLVGLAEQLIPDLGRLFVLELKLTVYAVTRSASLNAVSKQVYQKGDISIWETDLAELSGEAVARVFHTLVDDPAVAEDRSKEPSAKDKRAALVLDNKRDAIARAACEIISEKGFAISSMREIADAVGTHVATMYQYVASKDEVLELVYQWVMREMQENIASADLSALPAGDRLIAVTSKLLEANFKTPRHTSVLVRELPSLSHSARTRVLGEYGKIMHFISDIIAEGIELGEFRAVNPEIAANFIDALCDMWALRQSTVGHLSADEYEEELLNHVKAALFKQVDEA